jgi:hypothetical protein
LVGESCGAEGGGASTTTTGDAERATAAAAESEPNASSRATLARMASMRVADSTS